MKPDITSERHFITQNTQYKILLAKINQLSSFALLFADDIKLFRIIKNLTDFQAVQVDQEWINNCCKINNPPLNGDKCFVMSFSNNKINILQL